MAKITMTVNGKSVSGEVEGRQSKGRQMQMDHSARSKRRSKNITDYSVDSAHPVW